MHKLLLLILIPILIVTLCVNFVRVVITGDLSNNVSFRSIAEPLGEINADMTFLYKGANSIGNIFASSVGSWGELVATWQDRGNFFDKTLSILTMFGRLIYITVQTLFEGSAAVLVILDGLFALCADVFYLLHVVFGFAFTWSSAS